MKKDIAMISLQEQSGISEAVKLINERYNSIDVRGNEALLSIELKLCTECTSVGCVHLNCTDHVETKDLSGYE